MSDFSKEEATQPLYATISPVWHSLIQPLLVQLDKKMDCRLVATLGQSIRAILEHRHGAQGLLLSELGAYLLSPRQAPAGTKRLSNLLRSSRWTAHDIAEHLWQQAGQFVERARQNSEDVLVLWDQSVLEKPESQAAQGLCPVRSSKAARLCRIKPGYYRPPGAPIFVPGLQWMALLFIGRNGPPCVAAMKWWGTLSRKNSGAPQSHASERKSDYGSDEKCGSDEEYGSDDEYGSDEEWLAQSGLIRSQLLQQCQAAYGTALLHIFDRGFAGAPWLAELHSAQARFILRWPKHYKLCSRPDSSQDRSGDALKAWQHLRGKRSWEHQMVPDATSKRAQYRKTGVVAVRVFHPAFNDGNQALWLVAARPGKGREPWYLLTNEPVEDAAAAWRVVWAYARRWQIEMSFRFNKSELALESPRLWSWERRLKLLMIVTLVYAFLLALLRLPDHWRQSLLRQWCHRTGKRSRVTPTPLYRLRVALSRLFAAHPPDFVDYPKSKSPG